MPSMQRDASYEDGSFMSFKAVNRENLHLSPPFVHNHQWTGPTRLFSTSSTLGWFVAGTDDTVILSPLAELRAAFRGPPGVFQPKVSITLSTKPISVAFANNDSSLVVALLNGVICVYDSSLLRNADHTGSLQLMHTFSHSPEPIRDLQPNPSDKPEVVAVLRGDVSTGTKMEMLNVAAGTQGVISRWEGRGPQEAQISMSWSPKGKQMTVGDVTGALIQYTPEGVQKSAISAPPDRQAWPATSVIWLENTVFYVAYASPGVPSDEQEFCCYAIQTDKVGGTPTYISTPDAAPAFGDRSRESARFFVSLRDWTPMRHILIIADQPSTDVGIIAQYNDRPSSDWATLELEETDRVVLPMDDDGRDTYPVGIDIDLTSTDTVNLATHGGDETPPAPPSPILYVYMNTGHMAAYHVLNSRQPLYPGMNPSANSQTSTTTTTPSGGGFASFAKPGVTSGFASFAKTGAASGFASFAEPGAASFASSAEPGVASGFASFGRPGTTSSFASFAKPGVASGFASFAKPGVTSGFASFAKPGVTSGSASFAEPGATPAPASLEKSGATSGPAPFTKPATSGPASFAKPGVTSGSASFAKPGVTSGSASFAKPGVTSGSTSFAKPGITSGSASFAKPGVTSQFSSAPTRSSPLAATPPTNRNDANVLAQPKSEATPPLENQKPTIGGQVDRIISIMEKELEQLCAIAKQCNDHQNSIIQNKRQGEARFRDLDQWSLGDLKALRRQTNDLEDDTLRLEDESLALKTRITELQSLLLKAETSKQEIERLLRAREDKNFAKLLKVRALGPEHLENQTKLRKSIQLANGRVLQLEEQVAAMKRKVHFSKNGGNHLKAPSLDVIARAITNIETAALEKRNKMNALTDRLEALDLSVEESDESDVDERSSVSLSPKAPRSASKKREQTPLDEILARSTLTPKIKSVSANALNAERAGLRLKSALLAIRSRPLANISVIPKPVDPAKLEQGLSVTIRLPPRMASPKLEPSSSFTAAGKTLSFTSVVNTHNPFGGGKFGQGAVLNFTIPEKVDLPAWDLPIEGDEEQSGDSSRRRSGGRGGGGSGRSRHSPSVRLSTHSPSSSPETQKSNINGVSASPTPAPKFDWGFGDLAKPRSSVINPPGFVSLLDYKPTFSASAPKATSSTTPADSVCLPTSLKTGAPAPGADASTLSEDESGEDEDSRQKHLEEELEDALEDGFNEEEEEEASSHDNGTWEDDDQGDWDGQGRDSNDNKT